MILFVNIKPECFYESELEKLPKPSADHQLKQFKYTLSSMNAFLISLVKSLLGSQFKIMRISWYKMIKLFQDNLKLVIKKYLCSFHYWFLGIYYISNENLLSGMSKHNPSYNYISICFNWLIIFDSNDNYNSNASIYLISFKRWIWYREIYRIFKNNCIGCMADYTCGDYVYFKKMDDIPTEHHNHFILNQIQDMYIISPLKLMEWIFESLPNLFVDRMLEKCKWNKCIMQESKWLIFWVMLIFQNCEISLSFFWIESKMCEGRY